MSATTSNVLSFGNRTVNLSDLPPASVHAMVSKGIAHHMGNVQASKISTWKASVKEETGADPSDEAVSAKRAEFDEAAWRALLEGTVGTSAPRGPRGTTVEVLARAIAEKELAANLKANGKKMPSGKETLAFPNPNGGEPILYTKAQMIDRRLAHATQGPRIKKLAEKEFANLNRQGAAAAQVEGESILDA